jgi:protein involved in polysaccharide export with SLBB domain
MSLEVFMKPFALLVLSLVPLGTASAQAVTPDPAPERMPYVLAPMDLIRVHAPQAPKLNDRSFQIRPDGIVILPSLGRIQAAGLKTSELEKTLAARLKLKPKTSGEPAVTVSVTVSSNK